ncbi:MAG TPA: MotA/TolQ/ExbB proton channel family protein [Phycisphaerae bacterium]|nr:MotA/TolQ/ExbB proton channel family protein [Phycisphaerae bacterium]HOJ72390.1 MotA/TolQ/ExbB proton channel family protein [Phycisphaerae bacterium]HOM49948.1 MotA/TolQ/ExbB proton channel family protein [Phycisphaerae bacterium]HON66120.1 MotA/TolQ/ExbB proton channel family protein [Phycisphaerae bacterium]HOQ84575.1 MotA/TolQ/ExbB proton channel family protein [Phycisphaerae bacterium]
MLSRILFFISGCALLPVMVALLVLAGWMLLVLGGLCREAWTRFALRRAIGDRLNDLHGSDPRAAAQHVADRAAPLASGGFIPRYLRACWIRPAAAHVASHVVDEIELEMARSVAGLSTIARLGPMLGLAGTLIPLGPGLVSLSRGDVAGLAGQLVVAFSTTIVGLLIGMAAFSCAHIRRGWYARDLATILFLEQVRAGEEAMRT